MKTNKVTHRRSGRLLTICAIVFLVAAGIGVAAAYRELHRLWTEPCIITDVTAQATCTEGSMVKGGTVLDKFGIRNGANLAEIDFDARRREILGQIPNIRAISVTRQLPDRVSISVEERQPIVRLGVHGNSGATGRVADSEGVVFTCRRGTSMLPTIRERDTEPTAVGQRLTGRALAALRLIEATNDTAYPSITVLDADVAKQDYILMTLANYAQAKIAWEGMDNPTTSNLRPMTRRLDNLQKAIQSNVGFDAKIWNATEDNRIYADTRESIL